MFFLNKLKKWDTELRNRELFWFFFLIRLSCVFFSQTWFVPDEFWQSQEVAHHITFGYGYLTWEWREGIRSYLYPLAIAFFYKLLEILYLDKTVAFLYIVPTVHAVLSAFADLLFFAFTKRFYGNKIAFKASMCRTISWFTMYMSTRSLTNNLEEIFTIFCLINLVSVSNETTSRSTNYWLLHTCGFVSFVIRATAAINLIPIYVYQFFFLCQTYHSKAKLFWQFVFTGVLILGLNLLIDSYFHGSFLISSYNFLLYNVFHNVGVHYGTHPFHWYLTQGLPIILFTHLLFFFIGIKYSIKKLIFPIWTLLFNVFVYSLLAHKEFRFLNQTMPFSMIVCAYGVFHVETNYGAKITKFITGLVTISNFLMIMGVGLLHQRGPISLMKHLRSENVLAANDSVLFLIPCHSTPYYSYLHRNVTMRFLTCEPNIDKNIQLYEDEADRFDSNPESWFQENKDQISSFTHVVLFDNVYARFVKKTEENYASVKLFLDRFKTQEVFYHTFFEESERRGKNLILLTLKDFLIDQKKNNKVEL